MSSAYSIDGRRFTFGAPLSAARPIGAYVQIESDRGSSYLGQILEESVSQDRELSGAGVLLSRLTDEGPTRPTTDDVFGSGEMTDADPAVVATHLASTLRGAALHLGSVATSPGVPADLAAGGFGRHTFLCGQSGSGKTYTLGLILEQLLLETDIQIAVLDPNSDYVNLASVRPREDTGLDEDAYRALVARYEPIASRIQVFGGAEDQLGLKSLFGRLTLQQQALILGIDPIEDAEEYRAFIRVVGRLGTDDYTLGQIMGALRDSYGEEERRLRLRIANLGVAELSIWANDSDEAIKDQLRPDWRMVVFDLGSLSSDLERSIASASVLGTLWEERSERRPLLIVVDEAHNVCPQVPLEANQELATEHAVKIAGEGRKYGKYLLLSTQRPGKLHQNVISQCDNLVLMRMNSAADLDILKSTFSFAPGTLIDQANGFGLGEGLAAGKIAPDSIRYRTGRRFTHEGGSDVPSTWAQPR
jgi:DNA helicase HerA-like ATPase